ncbi:hypothetical protein E1295_33215 [Nonomuraea mesophila]|uniref:Uncharacterized protein n=1 Tax=Nonomuraea mesophila TaxID=2530382 RepID=A0A4R5EVR1_9ACTN|nr:hypothetical protein [Nonomuraea mesophila]TDE38817.1 hypothetical protein E1295_33215 [Nonomuraea mesophila]
MEGIDTVVLTPSGPTHTGPGSQYNNYAPTYVNDPRSRRPVRSSRAAIGNYLQWLHPRFIEPAGYSKAMSRLQEGNAVLLTGASGSGRRSAGQMLLHRLPGAEGPFTQISFSPADDREEPELELASGYRVLIDLSSTSDELYFLARERLEYFHAVVCERHAFLIAVVPDDFEGLLHGELARLVVPIGKPSGQVVLHQHLTLAGIKTPSEFDHPELLDKSMGDIRKISQLVIEGDFLRSGSLQDMIAQAIEAISTPAGNLSAMVAELPGTGRALLLSAAMLNGASVDALHSAAQALQKVAGLPEDDTPVLERAGLSEELGKLTNVAADTDGRIHFSRLGYDGVVRTHFWTDRPDMRVILRDWIGQVVESTGLGAGDRDRVITRFTEQALRTGRPDDLIHLAQVWTNRGTPAERWPDAVRILQLGLEDQRHGAVFRQKIISWAKEPRLPFERGQVLVEVCADVLVQSDPMSALIRLRHLARQEDRRTSSAAREVLTRLAEENLWFCRHLLKRLITRLESTDAPRRVDFELFLHISGPERPASCLITRDLWPLLLQGWKLVMARGEQPVWEPTVRRWLTGVTDGRLSEDTLTMLLDAATGSDSLLSRLYVIALRWARGSEASSALAERFCRRIDDRQGL